MAVQLVLHAQQADVGAQGHLAHTVAVEIKLVLLDVGKVLGHGQELLQSLGGGMCVCVCGGERAAGEASGERGGGEGGGRR